MKVNFLLLLIQTVLVSSITYRNLKSGVILKQGDQLISTLGYYKLVLISNNCSLNLYQFNIISLNYQYTTQKYQGQTNNSCSSLTIKNQNVVTDNGTNYLSLKSTDLVKVRLFVDDLANLRLIGERSDPFSADISYYEQLKMTNFSQTKPFIRILESFQKISDSLQNPITNNKDWVFTVTQNLLVIKNKTNQISKSFSLPSAFFSQIGIFDTNNQTYPYTNFDGMRYSTVCEQGKTELVGPFIIEVDNFWPVLRIYDQDGYTLFEYSLNSNSQFYTPCPKGTFLFEDKCDLKCPASYTKQLQNGRGVCRLNCEKGSILDKTQNTCVCKNRQISTIEQYFCVNSTSYQFGCYCQNNLFFDESTRKCVQNCPKGLIAYKGLCLSCSSRCSNCSLQSGYPFLVVCTSCENGYTLNQGICVESNINCNSNCLLCLQGICVACLPFYSLLNNTCIQQCSSSTKLSVLSNLTSFCGVQTDSQICPPSCQVCSNTTSLSCMVCKPEYYLLLSPLVASCQRKNLLFSCRSSNYVNFNDIVCYNNQSSSLYTLTKCIGAISNCLLCVYQSTDKCIVCNKGYFLQENKCVSSCSQGYYILNQACVPGISQCKINGFKQGQLYSNSFDLNIVTNNQVYNYLTSNGREQLNEPFGYQLFATKNYGLINNYNPTTSVIYWSQAICIQCNNGYGLSKDYKQCLPCPTGCLLCHNAYDGSCIATAIADVTLYMKGVDITNCKTFLSDDYKCISSCPENTSPSLSTVYQQLVCGTNSSQPQNSYLKIDGTSIQVSSNKYIHRFVFSQQLLNLPVIRNRLLQSSGSFDKNGTTFTVESDKPYFVLDLQGSLQNYKTVSGTYPANSIYGINIDTSYSNYIKHSLAYIGFILSLLMLMTHCIYVGNGYTYKMDNIIIFAQTIFYFLFTDVFISNPVSQYYYGWSWMHVNFYPNYFQSLLSADDKTIPPYALYNIDANFIRNAGGSISLLLTFSILWLLISGVCYYVEVKMGRWQIWYQKIFKNSLVSVIQFCAFNIFYWAVAYFRYDFNSDSKEDTKQSYTGLPVMFIIGIVGYTLIKFYLDIITPFWKRTNYYGLSSLYMIKRIVYASVIACSYQNKVYLLILIAFELCFTAVRYFLIQKPTHLKQKLIIGLETLAILFGMIILYTVTTAFAVASLITLVVYLWYLTFVIDLMDIYLISKNKILKNSWLPCLEEQASINSRESSKDDFQQQKTDRPFNSQVER